MVPSVWTRSWDEAKRDRLPVRHGMLQCDPEAYWSGRGGPGWDRAAGTLRRQFRVRHKHKFTVWSKEVFGYRKRRGGEFTQLWLHLHPGTKCHGGNKSYRERSSTSAWMWILSSLSCSSSHFKREWFLTLFKCGSFVCRHVLEEEVVTVSELKRALFFFFFSTSVVFVWHVVHHVLDLKMQNSREVSLLLNPFERVLYPACTLLCE